MGTWDDVYEGSAGAALTNVKYFATAADVLGTFGMRTGAYLPGIGRLPAMLPNIPTLLLALCAPLVRAGIERSVAGFRAPAAPDMAIGSDFAGAYMVGCWPIPLTSDEPWRRWTAPQTVADLSSTLDRVVTAFAAPALAAASAVPIQVEVLPEWRGGNGGDSANAVSGRDLIAGWTDLLLTLSPYYDAEQALGLMYDETQIEQVWRAIKRIALACDTIADLRITRTASDRVWGALGAAKDASAEAAGELIADAANFAGETAGQVGKGILEGLGLYGAAAVAAYFLLR